jgi:hypothetical protein
MIRKAFGLAAMTVTAATGLAIAAGWPDIQRFIKIKQMSDRPGMVPAEGRTAYPQHHDGGVADGTGDFDSASRGGPARA